MRPKIHSIAPINEILDIARNAGRAIMDIYNAAGDEGHRREGRAADVVVARKADDSPLTRADLAAHDIISASLKRLTPHVPVVSEEDEASLAYRLPTGEFWLIDPLDGTKEFIARNGEFTVNIALIRDGVAVFGAVFAPVLQQLYWGGQGIGAFRDDGCGIESVRVSACVSPGAACRVVASRSHLNPETASFIERLGRHELIQAGSSLKLCRVAEGRADIYPRLAPTCEWDTAAAQAVVEAAGGTVTDLSGEPLKYGKPDKINPYFIVASGLSTWCVQP